MHKSLLEHSLNINRRKFLTKLSIGLGTAALGSLLIPDLFNKQDELEAPFVPGIPHFAPKAKE